MFKLRDDYAKIKNGNIIMYLIVGLGNVGKSTLAKNICYFIDKKFSPEFVVWGITELMDKIYENIDLRGRAYQCDEPNDIPSPQSIQGKLLKQVAGQLRQQESFICFCSTDFKDIPSTIINKVTNLIYLDKQGHGYMIQDRPEYNEYPLSDIKKNYCREGYQSITNALKKFQFLEMRTHKDNILSVLDPEGERKYLETKKKELKRSIELFKTSLQTKSGQHVLNANKRIERNKKIIELHKQGTPSIEIADKVNLSERQVHKIIKDNRLKNDRTPIL